MENLRNMIWSFEENLSPLKCDILVLLHVNLVVFHFYGSTFLYHTIHDSDLIYYATQEIWYIYHILLLKYRKKNYRKTP